MRTLHAAHRRITGARIECRFDGALRTGQAGVLKGNS
jgi:hypothetical protein